MIPGLSELMIQSQPERKRINHVGQLRVEQANPGWRLLSGPDLIHWTGGQLVKWGLKLQASAKTLTGPVAVTGPAAREFCSDGCC